MQSIKIKTYKKDMPLAAHHFFLLSKGYNAGKPLEKSCPNCLVVWADSAEDKQRLFWVCYSLWKSGNYIPLLVGSVIPFVRIGEVRDLLVKAVAKSERTPNEFSTLVASLQSFHRLERQLDLQLKLIKRIKADLVKRFYG